MTNDEQQRVLISSGEQRDRNDLTARTTAEVKLAAQHAFPSEREDTHFMCHVRCTSDDCPPRTDHFGVHDGHVHVCRWSLLLVVLHRI